MTVTKKKKIKKAGSKDDRAFSIKEELFCQMFVKNTECFDNATKSYARAYDYDLDSLSKEAVYEEQYDDVNERVKKVKVEDSPYDKACNVCSSAGSQLLRKLKINDRINELLLEIFTEEKIDKETSWVANQRKDMNAKMRAIQEFNKIKKRVKDDDATKFTFDLKGLIGHI